ncbi:LysR family transcriptional regulator [Lactobacillaceae bacterium L1_55_11]|nr:LysR family transcriptional regulator [Lactobacillaceae bacterium L1_55_11]
MKTFTYQIFMIAAETRSFKKTADRLHITPSAVSHAVSQLEKQLGLRLFIRNRSEITLTPDGEQVLPAAEDVLSAERHLRHLVNNLTGLQAGTLQIGAFSSVCINWLPGMIKAFKKQHPNIQVGITQVSTFDEINQGIKSGKIDIGFTTLPTDPRFVTTPLLKDEIMCVVPSDFTPKNGHSITHEDLSDQHFILQKNDYDQETKAALDHYRVQPQTLNFSIDDQSIIALVEGGFGLGILPNLALKKLFGEVKVYPFDHPFYREIALITNSSQMAVPAVAAFKQVVIDYLRTQKSPS